MKEEPANTRGVEKEGGGKNISGSEGDRGSNRRRKAENACHWLVQQVGPNFRMKRSGYKRTEKERKGDSVQLDPRMKETVWEKAVVKSKTRPMNGGKIFDLGLGGSEDGSLRYCTLQLTEERLVGLGLDNNIKARKQKMAGG